QSLTDGVHKNLHRGGYSARYIGTKDSGFLVFVSQGTLFAISFDPIRLETHGTATPVLVDSRATVNSFQVSASGTAVYRIGGNPRNNVAVESLDSQGNRQRILKKSGNYQRPRFSPDGQRIVLTMVEDGRENISIYDPRRDIATPLTFGGDRN